MPSLGDALRQEATALRAALRRHPGAPPLLPPPPLDWRRWAGTSCVVTDPGTYFAVRVALATIMTTTLVGYWISFGVHHPLHFWFIYLTNWTLSVQVAYLCVACWATWVARPLGPAAADEPPPPSGGQLHALLALQAVATPGAALVTLLFWVLVFPTWRESAKYLVNYLVHGVNCAVALTDLALTRQPFRLAHAAVLLPAYCTLYISFSVVHYITGGTNEWGQPWIYKPIYWGAPDAWKGALLCAGLLLFFLPLLVIAFWAAAWKRDAWDASRGDTDDVGVLLRRLQEAENDGTMPLLLSQQQAAPAEDGTVGDVAHSGDAELQSPEGAPQQVRPSGRFSSVAL